MYYSREEITRRVGEALNTPSSLYAQRFINYRFAFTEPDGRKTPCSNFIARLLLDRLDELTAESGFQTITRTSPYNTNSHQKLFQCSEHPSRPEGSGRTEEWAAKQLCWMSRHDYPGFGEIGRVIDYQTPLKNKQDDSVGKIDLLFNKGKNLLVVELKKRDSDETLLRCALEAYTYTRVVDKKKLASDFGFGDDAANVTVEPCVLVFSSNAQVNQLLNPAYTDVRTLIEKLKVKVFTICMSDPEADLSIKPADLDIRLAAHPRKC